MQQETASDVKAPAKAGTETKELKTKMTLSFPEDHPFSRLQLELKRRGLKSLDLNTLMEEIFSQTPSEWWDEKLDALTPLEFKVNQALTNPEMREKFKDLLT